MKRAHWLHGYRVAVVLAVSVVVVAMVITLAYLAMKEARQRAAQKPATSTSSAQRKAAVPVAPALKTEVVMQGLSHPWEVAFLPDQSMLVSERGGEVTLKTVNAEKLLLAVPSVRSVGEGGLMGLTVDIAFAQNRFIYTCYNSTFGDIRLTRWVMNAESTGLTTPVHIVTGMPANTSGRHSGCRLKMDATGVLWVGTGDAAQAAHPQNPRSLGGKILRVDRNGQAAAGNLGTPFDPRVYSYGHRNVQGIALLPEPKAGVAGLSIEHGPNIDDEVNTLTAGNFGWAPLPPYNEAVPMTDKTKYPDAVDAMWQSGGSTIAPSGATFLIGSGWKAWNGALAVSALKGQQLRVQEYDASFKLQKETILFEKQFGRLRAATLGPGENLYLTTDNGSNDQIIRVTPQ